MVDGPASSREVIGAGCLAPAGYWVAGRVPSVTWTWVVWPFRSTSSVTVWPGALWLITRSSGWVASSAVPLTAVRMSPAWSPACSAGPPGTIDDWVAVEPPVWPWRSGPARSGPG